MAACGKAKKEEPEAKKEDYQENYNDGMEPAQRMDAIKVIFIEADKDGDKLLEKDEWVACAKALALQKNKDCDWNAKRIAAAEKEFKEIDKSGNGTVSLAELDLFITGKQMDAVREKFKAADKDKSRKLDKKEFGKFFSGEGMKKRAIAKLWKKCDKNGDGAVSYTEFDTWMQREMADGVLKETFGDMFESDDKERKKKIQDLSKKA